jgi:YVTN family beta-propeller protein
LTSACALAVTGLFAATAAPVHAAATNLTLAYVTDAGAQAIRVVDAADDSVVSTIPVVGTAMQQIVASPDNRTAYLVNDNNTGSGNIVSVIDTATDTLVKTLPINVGGGIDRLTFSPDGSTVYLLTGNPTSGQSEIEVVDSATGAVTATITGGPFGGGMAMGPDGATLLVTEWTSRSVAVVDTASGTITATIPLGGFSDSGALNPAGTAVHYCVGGSSIAVVDLASRSIVRTLTAGCGEPGTYGPSLLAFAPDGNTLWVNRGHDGLALISVATGAVTRTIPTGGATPNHLTQPTGSPALVRAPLAPSRSTSAGSRPPGTTTAAASCTPSRRPTSPARWTSPSPPTTAPVPSGRTTGTPTSRLRRSPA